MRRIKAGDLLGILQAGLTSGWSGLAAPDGSEYRAGVVMGRSPLVSCVLPSDAKSGNLESGMSDQSDDAVTDAAGGPAPAPDSRPARPKILGVRAGQSGLGRFVRPVDYARSRDRYRPPPDLYRWLNHRLGPAATSLGLSPRDVIALEVPGRSRGARARAQPPAHHRLTTVVAGPARLTMAGLNPHAGEGGHLGREELEVMIPVLDKLRGEGLDVSQPLPADTLFAKHRLTACDCVLAMYHDQGHVPMKLLDFEHTVNVSLGLPIIRTSVDHGTAFDIAGKNRADPSSMKAAMKLAAQLAARQLKE